MMDEQKEDSDSKFSFKPPLFQQRYTKVADIIRNSDVKKVNIFFFILIDLPGDIFTCDGCARVPLGPVLLTLCARRDTELAYYNRACPLINFAQKSYPNLRTHKDFSSCLLLHFDEFIR